MVSLVTKRKKEYLAGISKESEAVEDYRKEVAKDVSKSEKIDKLIESKGKKEIGLSLGKGRLISTPKAKIQSRNLLKALKERSNYKLVKEAEEREIVPDNRSLYFKKEYVKDMKKERKWLS